MHGKVLLIDDDRLQHRLTQGIFSQFRASKLALYCVDNYDAGLAALVSGEYLACLLDYQLGPRDGLGLIREAVARGCRTPIIFLTAETGDAVDTLALDAGALDYLVKGEITPRILERSLRYAVRLAETLGALQRLATRDELTGLLNRREFERVIQEEATACQQTGREFAVALVDVDEFKRINDQHGHAVGDRVLADVAARLTSCLSPEDKLARYGGDEFAIVFAGAEGRTVEQAGGGIIAAFQNASSPFPASVGPVTVSVGIARVTSGQFLPAELLRRADQALYGAKAAGRNCARIAAMGDRQ
jgi:two-component system, cell cycle response regulator